MTKVTAESLWREYQATVREINLNALNKRSAAAAKYHKAMDKLDKAAKVAVKRKAKP